jgi:5-methylthioadenosine/S-adenosylhomocysteine deaminase
MRQLVSADWVHHAGTFRRDHALLIDDAGRISAAGPLSEIEAEIEARLAAGSEAEGERPTRRHLGGRALCPGTVSAHSHAFQVFLRGRGDHPRGFADWVATHLYPLVERLDDDSLEAAALLCFHQMLRAGITTVGEFHYVHNDAGDHRPRQAELARIVLGAARRVGLRVGFISTIYDVATKPGQARMANPAQAALAHVRQLHAEFADDPYVNVLLAPHSLHGATREAIEGSAALAHELDTRWHIHLAEQEEDVPYAQRVHGARPLEVLEAWGVLSERTVLVHAIWLSEQERALLAERGGGVVSNPTTNMALGDGIAPLVDYLRRGVTLGLGTDLNAAPNVFHELRAAEYLQRVSALRMGCLPSPPEGTPDPARLFALGTRAGAQLLGVEAGELAPGQWADVLVIDLDDPSLLPGSVEGGDALLNLLSSAMVAETALAEVWVGGRVVAEGGVALGLAPDELRARVRGAAALRS